MAGESFVDVAIIGAGTAGLNALREVRHAGKSFVLVDHGPLGTTCSRVGCMPSKAALHAGSIWKGRSSPPQKHENPKEKKVPTNCGKTRARRATC